MVESFEQNSEPQSAPEPQRMNNGFRSAREELGMSKAELQSINEELKKVNYELKKNLDVLTRDVTGRKETEASIGFQARLLDTVEQAVIATDLDGFVIYWNQFAQKLYGWTAQEVVGRHIMELTTPEIMTEQALEIMSHLSQGNSWAGEFDVQRSDGTTFPAQIINSPINDEKGTLVGIVGVSIDITERKRQEASLIALTSQIERQARVFNTTLSSISDFAYIFDREGRFVYANQALLDLWGLRLEEAIGKNFFDLKYPDDLASRLQQQIQQVFDTRQGLKDETPYTSPTGAGGYYEYIFSPVFAADGTVEVVAGSTRDISERIRIETALRESRERLQMAMNAAKIYSWEVKLSTQQIEWSSNLRRVIGFDLPADFTAVTRLIHPEDREETGMLISQAISGGENYESEFRLVNPKNGEIVWLRGQGVLVGNTYDSQQRFVGITQNITERKRVEQALRESENKYRSLIEQAPDGIHTYDPQGNFIETNSKLCEMLGYSHVELLRLNVNDLIPAEDLAIDPIRFDELRAGRTLLTERRLRCKDGTFLHVEISGSMIRDGVLQAIIRDITERKQSEEDLRISQAELQKSHDELERRVAARTADLSQTNAILQEEVRERQRIEAERVELLRRIIFAQEDERRRIAREMHDQFGQQLTALKMKLDKLSRESGEPTNLLEQVEALQAIAEQLDEDVDYLAWEMRPTELDDLGLHAALSSYVQNWSKHFGLPVQLHASGMNEDRLTSEMETALYRIAQEALNNVAKHARARGVAVVLERRGDQVSLIIEDNGVGFDWQRVLEAEDKGLGLIGMRERAALVGGTIEIESEPNEGATVVVRIPTATGDRRHR